MALWSLLCQNCVRWTVAFTVAVPVSAVCVMRAGLVRRVTKKTVILDVLPAHTDTATMERASASQDGMEGTVLSV